MYEVIKDRPSPGLRSKYPFDRLEVGDCFIVPNSEANPPALYSASYAASKHLGMKFTVRKTPEGYGVWRVS
jgi:hypothetical protein